MSAVTLAAVAAARLLESPRTPVPGTTAKIIIFFAGLAMGARART